MSFPWVGTIHKSGGVKVRGEDQLFGIREQLSTYIRANISGADGYIESIAVPAGRIWCVRTVVAHNDTTAPSGWHLGKWDGAAYFRWHSEKVAIAIGEYKAWAGEGYVDAGGHVRVYWPGGLVADDCRLHVCGFVMTLET